MLTFELAISGRSAVNLKIMAKVARPIELPLQQIEPVTPSFTLCTVNHYGTIPITSSNTLLST